MARYSTGATATAPGGTNRSFISLFAASGSGAAVREIGVTNNSTTEFAVAVKRLTAQGAGVGTALTEGKQNPNSPTNACTAFYSASADHTVGDDLGYRATVGAAKGAGIVFTFGGDGLVIAAGTANGIGLLPTGTAQACEVYIVWDE